MSHFRKSVAVSSRRFDPPKSGSARGLSRATAGPVRATGPARYIRCSLHVFRASPYRRRWPYTRATRYSRRPIFWALLLLRLFGLLFAFLSSSFARFLFQVHLPIAPNCCVFATQQRILSRRILSIFRNPSLARSVMTQLCPVSLGVS